MSSNQTFMGYVRPDGQVGIRNHVAIIPSCGCALHAAQMIAAAVEGAVLLHYSEGCGITDADMELAKGWLTQYGQHPNVIGSVVVGLGCEGLDPHDLAERMAQGSAPVELLVIQEQGGTRRTIEKGLALAQEMVAGGINLKREPCPLSALTIGLECGGSDATSGLAANPSVGVFSDLMTAQDAKVLLAETSELLGAEHILRQRAATPAIANSLLATIEECERFLKSTGEDFMGKQPSPGNVRGGITTVEEKALGDVLKGGSSPIVDVLRYGEPPTIAGLSFMDTPGNDLASVTGLVAAGSHIVIFTTGRGNPMGNPIAPVIKITGNPQTYAHMQEDMDINAGLVITGDKDPEAVGREIYDLCLRVAEGEETKAEALEHGEFMLLRQGPVY